MTVQPADTGDTASLPVTMEQAETNLVAKREESYAQAHPQSGIEEVVTDKGYHSDEILMEYAEQAIRTYISEPKQKSNWKGKARQKKATLGNRRRIRGKRGKALLRRRGEPVERPFAHRMDRGRLRRLHVRGNSNVYKQELLLSAAQKPGAADARSARSRHAAGARGSRETGLKNGNEPDQDAFGLAEYAMGDSSRLCRIKLKLRPGDLHHGPLVRLEHILETPVTGA